MSLVGASDLGRVVAARRASAPTRNGSRAREQLPHAGERALRTPRMYRAACGDRVELGRKRARGLARRWRCRRSARRRLGRRTRCSSTRRTPATSSRTTGPTASTSRSVNTTAPCGAEVLVADVAAADDRRLVVGGERLVVHPPVDAREVGQEVQRTPPAHGNGLKSRTSTCGCASSAAIISSRPARVDVVEQQAHAHAALGCAPHGFGEQRAGIIVAPQVILDVEGRLSEVQQGARGPRTRSGKSKAIEDGRRSRMRSGLGRDRAAQTRRAGVDGRHRRDAAVERRQRRAAGDHRRGRAPPGPATCWNDRASPDSKPRGS